MHNGRLQIIFGISPIMFPQVLEVNGKSSLSDDFRPIKVKVFKRAEAWNFHFTKKDIKLEAVRS